MERWATIMSLWLPLFFLSPPTAPFVRDGSDDEQATTSLYILMKAPLTARARRSASPRLPLHSRVLSHLLQRRKIKQSVKRKKQSKRSMRKKCKRFRRSREGFLGEFWRPVDVWVAAGAAGREGYQPGSSDAGPHASDVKGEQE